ncbi:MAG: 6-phosphofructokinase [Gemmatimonadetes bacterium]|nr:MAG: 6-phosphofructokinase [Gemmatimonadota bacterium]
MNKCIGILTSGGDCPGLNAAIRAVGKSSIKTYNREVIGFKDGFRGLVENRFIRLERGTLSGILTLGGTLLGTSRDKPHKMPVGRKLMDMTDVAVENYHKQHLDVLVCLGGGGTQKNAFRLHKKGLNIITLPKTIDNDVWNTDITFGFDTAMSIATEAIDRLHSTAESHHRIIIVEIMGHNAGWLTLGAGMAGGADVILIPEIPYDIDVVTEALLERSRRGKRFSIIAVAEGALTKEEAAQLALEKERKRKRKLEAAENPPTETPTPPEEKSPPPKVYLPEVKEEVCVRLARQLQEITRLEARVTSLGHLQRGGTPSAADRLLATRLGTVCSELISREQYGVMVAIKNNECVPVPLEEVAGRKKLVPLDHSWVKTAQRLGICLGDEL